MSGLTAYGIGAPAATSRRAKPAWVALFVVGVEAMNIYVGNLPFSATENELAELFSQFGQVSKASVLMDRDSGRSRGFGFVEMVNAEDGKKAITALNGQPFGNRTLTVNEARPREPRVQVQAPQRGSVGYSNRR